MERRDDRTVVWCARVFWTWLALRTAAWVAVSALSQPNPPLDLAEWAAWGHSFEWGYHKHPPVGAWLLAAAAWLGMGDIFGGYVVGYVCAAVNLWAVWMLGREFLSPRGALLSAVCLDGLFYLTIYPCEFSNNVLFEPTWALTALCFVKAIRTDRLGWWIAMGVAAGLGFMSKYALVLLLAPMAGYLIFEPSARIHWRRPGPYLAAIIAAAIFAPHLAWLAGNDFLPLVWARDRTVGEHGWTDRFRQPLQFIVEQFAILIPVLVALYPLLRLRSKAKPRPGGADVLHWIVLGPPAIMLVLSLATGIRLRVIYGAPLWAFVGVWLLAFYGSATKARFRRGIIAAGAVGALMLGVCVARNVSYPYLTARPTRIHFPGKQLADEVARRWHERRDEPFPIVAGEMWRASTICCFAPQRPVVYTSSVAGEIDFEGCYAPWTGDADLRTRGGVIVWDADKTGDDLPAAERSRFPDAEVQAPIVATYQTNAAVKPSRVGIAFVWPKDGALASRK